MSLDQRSAFHTAKRVNGRMVRLLLLVMLLTALASIAVQQWAQREALHRFSTQLSLDHGRRIASALERLGAAPARRDALLQSYYDEIGLQRLELIESNGVVVFRRQRPPVNVDRWTALERLWRPEGQVAEVPLYARAEGSETARLRLELPAVDLRALMWRSLLESAALLGLALLAVFGVGLWALRPLSKQVGDMGQRISDGQNLSAGSSASWSATSGGPAAATTAVKPIPVPVVMQRLQADLSARAAELERLGAEAHIDPLTGLPKRQYFMARLELALDGRAAWPVSTILLVRVRDLAAVNRRVGHHAANTLLTSLGMVLRDVAENDPGEGALSGRLNGADFALLLPSTGAGRSQAEAVLMAMRRHCALVDPDFGLAIGVAELSGPCPVKSTMALLDEALSRAEADVPFALAMAKQAPNQRAFGASAWQQRLADALARQRAMLAVYPVCGPDGQLIHLDCPMRVQFEDGGMFESAWRWLAPALRGRYCAQLDTLALQMALDAIADDGVPRCINLSAQSMDSIEFVTRVTHELETRPSAARLLWIDLPELLAVERPTIVKEVARLWRPLGVKLCLEHAGQRIGRILQLDSLGLDCIRVDGSFIRGLTGPDSVNGRRHLKSILHLASVAGLTVTAEAVSTASDLTMVWALGFDAATGPAVQQRAQSMSLQ